MDANTLAETCRTTAEAAGTAKLLDADLPPLLPGRKVSLRVAATLGPFEPSEIAVFDPISSSPSGAAR